MQHSMIYLNTKRGTKGKRATRFLDDARVGAAMERASNPNHQRKFLSGPKRRALELKESVNRS